MRSLSKLIPGVHPKLPGDSQEYVKRIYAHAEEHHEELNLYITGEEEALSERPPEATSMIRASPRPTSRPRPYVEPEPDERRDPDGRPEARLLARLRLARLHARSSTARWRSSPSGSASSWSSSTARTAVAAGVIAEHNQELADTLNARTFALAQSTGLAMMNICSTCQGAQSECQQRLDADSAYRAHINEALADEGLEYEKGRDGWNNKNFLWVLVEDYGLDRSRRRSPAR